MLILTVETPIVDDVQRTVRTVEFLTSHGIVDLVRVNVMGIGMGVAESLKRKNVTIEEFRT